MYFWMESIILDVSGLSRESVAIIDRNSTDKPLETGGLKRLFVIDNPTVCMASGDCRSFVAPQNQRWNMGEDG